MISIGEDSGHQEFELSIADRISGPLMRMEAHLQRVAGVLDKLDKATKQGGFMANLAKNSGASLQQLNAIQKQLIQSQKQWAKLHATANGGGGSGKGFFSTLTGGASAASFGLGLLGKAVDGVGWALQKGYEYGKSFVSVIVEAAKQRGLVMTAYEIMLGSRGKAESQLQKTLDIASLTPASNMQMVDITKRLLVGGFAKDGMARLDSNRAAAADIQAAFGDNRMNQYIYTMTKVKSRGEARNSDINSFGMYINARSIRENIARQMASQLGYKEGAYDNVMDRKVQDLVKHHGVSEAVLEVAVQKALMEELKQKQLGAYAKKKGIENLAGLLSNLEEIIPTFLMRLDIDHFEGIKELKRFLTDLLDFFRLSTPEGKALARVVEELVNELFGGLKNITKDDMGKFFRGGVEVAKHLVSIIREAWGWMDKLLHGNADDLIESTGYVLVEVGKLLGLGIWKGFMAAMGFGDRSDRRPYSVNVGERRKELERQGITPDNPLYDAMLNAPSQEEFLRRFPNLRRNLPSGPRLDMNGKMPEPTTPAVYGPPAPPVVSGGAAMPAPAAGPKLDVIGDFEGDAKKIGEMGARGFLEGAGGPDGLDNGSPSKKARKIGQYGALGFLGGLEGTMDRGGGGGVTIHGDLHVNVSTDSATEEMRFKDWLLRVLRDEVEEVTA